MRERVIQAIEEGLNLRRGLESEADHLLEMARRCQSCLAAGGRLLFAGNGGSAADAQHLATELVVRLRPDHDRAAMAGLALTTDTSLLTACANDYSFNQIFVRQLQALGRRGDILIALSTSGNSGNLLEAAPVARERGIAVIGLLGGSGGKLRELCDDSIVIPSRNPGRVQELHITIGHLLIELIEELAGT